MADSGDEREHRAGLHGLHEISPVTAVRAHDTRPSLLLLASFDRSPGPLGSILVTYGRVPLFFYLLHVPIIHAAAMVLAQMRHGASAFLLDNPGFGRNGYPPDYGYDLPVVYLATLCVVAVLYPLCYWYGDFKRKHPSLWLSLL